MALFSFASAKGSPGVSLAMMAIASTWESDPVVADLDTAGGDLAWRYRRPDGEPVDLDRGLLSLAASVRRGAHEADLAEHLQPIGGGIDLLAGLGSPTQVSGLGQSWGQLPAVFASTERDVLADCGRVVPGSAVMPVLSASAAVLFVVEPTVEGTAHLRDRLTGFKAQLSLGEPDGVPVAVAVVTSHKDTSSARDLQKLLDSAGIPATVLGVIVHDPKAAKVLQGQASGRIATSLLIRSAADVGTQLRTLAADRRLIVR